MCGECTSKNFGGSLMTEKSIGDFIQELRKENGLTQKELASQIGISDKTISKWENGNSVPDTSMLLSLCKALDISVNELLSGNKLPPEQYSMKAEENIMDLLKDKEQNSKSNSISVIMGILEDITHMGKNLCVASLAPMYALLAYLILIPVIERLKRK